MSTEAGEDQCFYSEQIARIQGTEPKRMHVVLGTREQRSFLVEDQPTVSGLMQAV